MTSFETLSNRYLHACTRADSRTSAWARGLAGGLIRCVRAYRRATLALWAIITGKPFCQSAGAKLSYTLLIV